MADYQLILSDPWGTRLVVVDNDQITKLAYSRVVNAVGSLTLTTTRDAIPDAYVSVDARIEVWRKPAGGTWVREGDGPFLIQTDTPGVSDREGRYRRLTAATLNSLLTGKYVMYYANSAGAKKTAAADNLMKAIVRENLGSSANSSPIYSGTPTNTTPSRDWSAYLSVAADLGLGPSISKGFAWRQVLPVLQEISRSSVATGPPIYFDIVATGGALMEFRTYAGARGIDRSAAPNQLVISSERGSLGGTVECSTDWSEVVSWVVVGGKGQESARAVGNAPDLTRAGASPFSARERFIDFSNLDQGEANMEAFAELRKQRPVRLLTGDLLSVPGAVYGLDWGLGDKLLAEFEQRSWIARVDSVTVTVDGGQETIKAAIKGEATV